jgi:hypothetical protein
MSCNNCECKQKKVTPITFPLISQMTGIVDLSLTLCPDCLEEVRGSTFDTSEKLINEISRIKKHYERRSI